MAERPEDRPVLVLCCSDKERYLDRYAEPDKGVTDRDEGFWPVPYWDIDTGMAALLILLGAVDAGLGSCFFGIPVGRHKAVHAALAIPPDRRLVGVVSVGPGAGPAQPLAEAGSSPRRGDRPLGPVRRGITTDSRGFVRMRGRAHCRPLKEMTPDHGHRPHRTTA